ncbi:hypothetical protein [Kribbella kalugense]|uniref:hypothetical protein n=1 Tax=Kribbella kalugense TaxID=2512221 RepID=UPI0010662813|nr:hypothetical protein [Kribbella kalugense]
MGGDGLVGVFSAVGVPAAGEPVVGRRLGLARVLELALGLGVTVPPRTPLALSRTALPIPGTMLALPSTTLSFTSTTPALLRAGTTLICAGTTLRRTTLL